MEKKTCSMIELKPEHKHTADDRSIYCECNVCKSRIIAMADFDKEGHFVKATFPLNHCPNCKAEIERFILYRNCCDENNLLNQKVTK